MKIKSFWYLVLLTFVILYVAIGFIRWEFDWIKHLSDTSNMNRLWFIIAIAAKLGLDVGLWSFLKEKPRKEEDQKGYTYEDE